MVSAAVERVLPPPARRLVARFDQIHHLQPVYGIGLEDKLIEHGIYKRTRNPQYIGYGTMFVGSAVAAGSTLALLSAFSFLMIIHVFITWVEEPHMKRTFGETFERYAGTVRRYW